MKTPAGEQYAAGSGEGAASNPSASDGSPEDRSGTDAAGIEVPIGVPVSKQEWDRLKARSRRLEEADEAHEAEAEPEPVADDDEVEDRDQT